MFQAAPPPIIRSSKLYIQHRVFVELLLLLTTCVSELGLSPNSLVQAVQSRKSSTDTQCCVYRFELLMMGRRAA